MTAEPRLKRSYIRRRPRRNRPPVDWPALQNLVYKRDQDASMTALQQRAGTAAYPWLTPIMATSMIAAGNLPCPAWIIEGGKIECGDQRSWRIDHVRDAARMGQKAEDELDNLIALCDRHDERGMTAGAIWNTSHRAEEREYLRRFDG